MVASYSGGVPSPEECPAADCVPVCCWQWTSTPLDTNYFYGDAETWRAYATGEGADMPTAQEIAQAVWEYAFDENPYTNNYNKISEVHDEVLRRDDPTGREQNCTTHEHVKWIAASINGEGGITEKIDGLSDVMKKMNESLQDIKETLDKLSAKEE